MNFKKQTAEQHDSRSHLIKGKLLHVPICLCTEKKKISPESMKKLIRGKDNHSENGMSGRRTYFSLYVLQQICTM